MTLHSYRARWHEAEPDPRSAWLEDSVKATKSLSLPTLYFQGEADAVNPPQVSESVASKFTGPFKGVLLAGVGHFASRETPDAVATKLLAFLSA